MIPNRLLFVAALGALLVIAPWFGACDSGEPHDSDATKCAHMCSHIKECVVAKGFGFNYSTCGANCESTLGGREDACLEASQTFADCATSASCSTFDVDTITFDACAQADAAVVAACGSSLKVPVVAVTN